MVRHHIKPTRKQVNHSKRHFALNGDERTEISEIRALVRRLLRVYIEKSELPSFNPHAPHMIQQVNIIQALLRRIRSIIAVNDAINSPIQRPTSKNRTIESFQAHELNDNFRFASHDDLKRLFNSFKFGRRFHADNHQAFEGEEILLLGLYRLSRSNSSTDKAYTDIFGRADDEVSRMFKLFISHMYQFTPLVTNNLKYWMPKLDVFANSIKKKCAKMNCPFDDGFFCVYGFIDCTVVMTCATGTGPDGDGPGAPRHDGDIQRCIYNSWKKGHGLKFQLIDLPNGMTFNMSGVTSCRHPDPFNLNESKICERISNVHPTNTPANYCFYGDAAYISADFVKGKHHGNLTVREELENTTMSSCRQSVEWSFAKLKTIWKRISTKNCLKLQRGNVVEMITVALLLTNAHSCMYGNQAAQYYDCSTPRFEDWMASLNNTRED